MICGERRRGRKEGCGRRPPWDGYLRPSEIDFYGEWGSRARVSMEIG